MITEQKARELFCKGACIVFCNKDRDFKNCETVAMQKFLDTCVELDCYE